MDRVEPYTPEQLTAEGWSIQTSEIPDPVPPTVPVLRLPERK